MEAPILAFITNLVAAGVISTNSLIVIIIILICAISYYFIRPMFQKVDKLPTTEQIEEMLQRKMEIDSSYVADLERKLDKLIEWMDELEDLNKDSNREIMELRRDIETIKQILNQFQGHMLYSRNDFGNKELK